MAIQLKRELCKEKVSAAIPASLKAQIQAFMATNGVTESAAVRFILGSFFDNELPKIGSQHAKNKSLSKLKATAKDRKPQP